MKIVFVLTLVSYSHGYFEQIEMPDEATCRVYQAHNIAEFGEDLDTARCEWVEEHNA